MNPTYTLKDMRRDSDKAYWNGYVRGTEKLERGNRKYGIIVSCLLASAVLLIHGKVFV